MSQKPHSCNKPTKKIENGYYCQTHDIVTKHCPVLECHRLNSSIKHNESQHMYDVSCVSCNRMRMVCDKCFQYVKISTEPLSYVGPLGLEYIYTCPTCGELFNGEKELRKGLEKQFKFFRDREELREQREEQRKQALLIQHIHDDPVNS